MIRRVAALRCRRKVLDGQAEGFGCPLEVRGRLDVGAVEHPMEAPVGLGRRVSQLLDRGLDNVLEGRNPVARIPCGSQLLGDDASAEQRVVTQPVRPGEVPQREPQPCGEGVPVEHQQARVGARRPDLRMAADLAHGQHGQPLRRCHQAPVVAMDAVPMPTDGEVRVRHRRLVGIRGELRPGRRVRRREQGQGRSGRAQVVPPELTAIRLCAGETSW